MHINANPVFQVLSAEEQNLIQKTALIREIERGSYLVNQGELYPYLFIIEKGQLVAEKDSYDGRTFVAATFKPGDIFWGISFFIDNATMPASFRAFTDTRIYLWSKKDLEPLIRKNGSFSWEISRLAVSRIQYASEILEAMTFQPIAVRLARLLVGIADNEGKNSIERNLTLDEMAARIGSTREMVCRLLYKFSDEGLIRITRTEFTITDQENLSRRAQK